MAKYTQAQLEQAFDLVKNSRNWKVPVNAVIAADEDQALISAAVIHFTGSVPVFSPARDKRGNVRVRAAGYYATIGA